VALTESLVFVFVFRWWNGNLSTQIQKELFWASHTLIDWASFCRDVVIKVVLMNSEPIGAPGVIVDIDESMKEERRRRCSHKALQ
jgi:hypothetical protein